MKLLRFGAAFAVGVALVAVLWAVVAPRVAGPLGSAAIRGLFQREQRHVASQAVLDQIRDLAELRLLSYVSRVVFPHDYYLEGESGYTLARIAAEHSEPATVLSPRQVRHLRAFDVAVETGLAESWQQHQFAVVTVAVTLGIDLASLSPDWLTVDGAGHAEVVLPPPTVLDVSVEDPSESTRTPGNADLSPGEWREVVAFVTEEVGEQIDTTDLEARARRNAQLFFQKLLSAGEISSVGVAFSDQVR